MVKNIRLIHQNMTRVGSYFYSFDHVTDTMIQKADDGTLAFAYPLDTTLSQEVRSLEFDGESFWTMSNIDGTPANGFEIRRWNIEDFVMVQQQKFTFDTDSNDSFESNAFTLEKYESTLTVSPAATTSTLTVAFDTDIFDLITPGTRLFIGPSTRSGFAGQSQAATVATTVSASKIINLTAPLTVGFLASDTIVFSKNIWVFNQNYLKTAGVGGLYKINSLDGSILFRQQGGAYKDINAAGFHEVSSFVTTFVAFNKPYLLFLRTNNLLFLNPNDANLTVELSAVQNNLSPDTQTVHVVYDLGIENDTIFRLQKVFNINGAASSESDYNYQLATFKPFPIAIAITAVPAILPADSGVSTSLLTATVTNQYGLAFVTSPVATIKFSFSGGGSGGSLNDTGDIGLDGDGQATNTYNTGDAAGLVTISAVVTL